MRYLLIQNSTSFFNLLYLNSIKGDYFKQKKMGRKIKVVLQPVKFRNKDHISILSPNDSEVDRIVREFQNSEWSTGYRFWHLPFNSNIVNQITEALKGTATVDSSALKNFQFKEEALKNEQKKRLKTPKPSIEQQIKLETFKNEFLLNKYSEGTIKVYMCMLNVFFGWFNNKSDNEINNDDIEFFFKQYIDANNFTLNYKRLMYNTLRRYFDFIDKSDIKLS